MLVCVGVCLCVFCVWVLLNDCGCVLFAFEFGLFAFVRGFVLLFFWSGACLRCPCACFIV